MQGIYLRVNRVWERYSRAFTAPDLVPGRASGVEDPEMANSLERWVRARMEHLAAASRVVRTPRGSVEFADAGEEGPAVLVVHGTPGGYDQGLVVWEVLEGSPYRAIAVSRPGYLRTPLEVGRTPAEQAARILPQAEIILVEGARHSLFFQRGQELAPRIRASGPFWTATPRLPDPPRAPQVWLASIGPENHNDPPPRG
jgi:hypothetical protein